MQTLAMSSITGYYIPICIGRLQKLPVNVHAFCEPEHTYFLSFSLF